MANPNGNKPRGDKKMHNVLYVRVTEAEDQLIRELAAKQHMTLAECVRAYVVSAAIAAKNPGAALTALVDDRAKVERVRDQRELEDRGQLRIEGA